MPGDTSQFVIVGWGDTIFQLNAHSQGRFTVLLDISKSHITKGVVRAEPVNHGKSQTRPRRGTDTPTTVNAPPNNVHAFLADLQQLVTGGSGEGDDDVVGPGRAGSEAEMLTPILRSLAPSAEARARELHKCWGSSVGAAWAEVKKSAAGALEGEVSVFERRRREGMVGIALWERKLGLLKTFRAMAEAL